MPFLRAAQIGNEKKHGKGTKTQIISVGSVAESQQLIIPFGEETIQDTTSHKNHYDRKAKGTQYELFVGKLYQKHGYIVDYNGINKGSWDGGIDLICKHKTFTILVQCKCYDTQVL